MIEIIEIDYGDILDQYVLDHPKCHFMQTSLWGRVKCGWEWKGILYRDPLGKICGSLALLLRRQRFTGSALCYVPRGPIWDEGNTEALNALLHAAIWVAKEEKSYLLRIDPEIPETEETFSRICREMNFQCNNASDFSLFQPRLCYVLSLEGQSEESLLASYHRSTRYHVHLALRREVQIRYGTEEDIPIFYDLMLETAKRKGFYPREEAYYRELLRGLGNHCRLYLAEEKGTVIGASMAVFYGNTAWYMYGCSKPEAGKAHANELLQWSMQCDAIRAGCKRFDFRGVEGPANPENPKFGLHRFKQSFGAELHVYVGQMDLILRPWIAGFTKRYSKFR